MTISTFQKLTQRIRDQSSTLLTRDLVVLLMILLPPIVLAIVDPDSFVAGWNEGRGGLLFAVFFAAIEWYDLRQDHVSLTRREYAVWGGSLVSLALFYVGIMGLGLRDALATSGRVLGLPDMPSMFSWISALEFIVFGLYTAAILVSSYGLKSLKKYVTPIAYLFGMAVIFLLDAAFPYDQLGPLQSVVLILVPPVLFFLNLLNVSTTWRPTIARLYIYRREDTLLVFRGALDFYWPCVGVHSMIIFLLIIIVMIAKLDAPKNRKIMYSAVGAIGTVLTNITRIFAVSYYVAIYGIEKARAFHESIGEIMFLVWVILFLVVAIKVEDWLVSRASNQNIAMVVTTPTRPSAHTSSRDWN
ncbi:MAG: exosortase/archaeosortase family protein [archaeon]